MRSLLCLTALAVLIPAVALADNVLVWSTGNTDFGDVAGVAAYLSDSGYFDSVTGINQDWAFTLPQLEQYDRVLYFSNESTSQDPVAIGNVLADYADTGRRLVVATFAWAWGQGNNTVGGRIMSDQICPFALGGGTLYHAVTMNWNDGSDYFWNVNTVSGFFHDDVSLVPGAVAHATWSDGRVLLADKNNVAAVDLFPDGFFDPPGGDYQMLFANALAVPEPTALSALVLAGLIGLRRR